MRAKSRSRLPLREVFFLAALVGAAITISVLSGRTLVLLELLKPMFGGMQSASNTVNAGTARVVHLRDLETENRALKARVGELETALRAREEQAVENNRLHDLLKLPVPAAAKPITVARVVGRNPDNWHQRLLLDKGQSDGVQVDAVIANSQGLIGKAVGVGPTSAIVAMLTDPTSSVSVLNARTRSAGVVQGQGDAWPALRYMEQPEKWKVGDRLITSGLGGVFPKGIFVGRIVKLKTASDAFLPELRMQPAVALDKLEEIIVLPPHLVAMPEPTPAPTAKPKPSEPASQAASAKPQSGHTGTSPHNARATAAPAAPAAPGATPAASPTGAAPASAASQAPASEPSAR